MHNHKYVLTCAEYEKKGALDNDSAVLYDAFHPGLI